MSHSDKIKLFKEETIKFNTKHNLISRKNTEKIIDEAIEEATALTKHLKQHKKHTLYVLLDQHLISLYIVLYGVKNVLN